ncbi:MAG: 50S ribosomal protein L18 [Anaerolineae bacterium]|nr:50S ribosomal protein L18 [Anaerolineae bacterium]
MGKTNVVHVARKRRHARVRKRLRGTPECPRLNVFRSLNHIYAQLIDDSAGVTLTSASSLEAISNTPDEMKGKSKVEQAGIVGKMLGERAVEAGISRVVFDRGGYKYHGRVKALAEGSREAGLKF